MALVFLETSAFLKLYLVEKGSSWLKSFISGNQVVLSQLTLAESATTLQDCIEAVLIQSKRLLSYTPKYIRVDLSMTLFGCSPSNWTR